jgi:asparagine synthase (glutamine-hydrolysing)
VGRRTAKAFAFADESENARIARYFDWAPRGATSALFSPEARAALADRDAMAPLVEAIASLPPMTPPLNRMLMLESKFFLPDHNLNYTDKMAMARGVEVRVPLLDPELVAFAARLPLGLKQRGATGKWIFKRSMEPLLPREVIYRDKTGFGAPLRHWLAGPLASLVDGVLSEGSLRARGVFDPRGVRALIDAHRAGRVDGAYTLLALVCIELWCRMFVDVAAPCGPAVQVP